MGLCYLGERKKERTHMMGAFPKGRPRRECRENTSVPFVRMCGWQHLPGTRGSASAPPHLPASLCPSSCKHSVTPIKCQAPRHWQSLGDRHLYAPCRFPTWMGRVEQREKGFVLRFCPGGEGSSKREGRCQACRRG